MFANDEKGTRRNLICLHKPCRLLLKVFLTYEIGVVPALAFENNCLDSHYLHPLNISN